MVDASQFLDKDRTLLICDDRLFLEFKDKPMDLQISLFQTQLVEKIAKTQQPQRVAQKVDFRAIYGIIQLKELSYLILVTKANIVGQIMQKQIFQVEKIVFYPISASKRAASGDSSYINMLQGLFKTKTFFYSEDYDLTSSLQKQMPNPHSREATSEFFINEHLLYNFLRSQVMNYVPIFISGLVIIKYAKVNNSDCDLALISRRDKRRMGRRFISRGADLDGNVSNFAETEQIISYSRQNEHFVYAFVQTRGSMPFKWAQKPNLKWSPKGQIIGTETKNLEICKRHFQGQYFNNQVLVNLIDRKGTQLMLGKYFEGMVKQMNDANLQFIWFDFHHECRNMKYENLGKLLDQMKSQLSSYSQFGLKYQKQKGLQISVLHLQSGVIRTNCMDCLDRTNVVQSVIARQMLWSVLANLGVQRTGRGALEQFPGSMEQVFRDVWTKNADSVSLLYTGTGALKTDFTKTGKRTLKGALQDGRNSLVRYVFGNFSDAGTQNALDLLNGKLQPDQQSFSAPGIGLFFLVFLIIIGVPSLVYMLLSRQPRVNLFSLVEENIEQASAIAELKVLGITMLLVGLSFIVTQKLVVSNYSKFVKKPVIQY